jgi:magnesium chelatase subunit D
MSLLGARPALPQLATRLEDCLGWGARVGETSVASLRVHTLDPVRPGLVTVLADRDAGRTFYGRRLPDEVLHIDVFHAVGEVDCRLAASAVRAALAAFRADFGPRPGVADADLYDVQTGAGGGRVSGSLAWGRRPSLLRAHKNHVHVAGRRFPGDAGVVFYIVHALEQAIVSCGLELRRLEGLRAELAGSGAGWDDLSPYAAESDTRLREDGLRGARGEPWPEPGSGTAAVAREALLLQAAELADEMGGTSAMQDLLAALAAGRSLHEISLPAWSGPRLREALARLQRQGWAEVGGGRFRLTERGRDLADLFRHHLREVELALRAAARRIALPPSAGGPGRARSRVEPSARGSRRSVRPRVPGEPIGELAVSETVLASARRQGATGGGRLRVRAEDLRVTWRLRPRRADLCLLLDASASMEGGRMRAAKTLARHLLLTSRDRVAVMAFQERSAALAVPFTRNYAAAERGLGRVVPAGLTPLAAGLAGARAYLQASHAKRPMLLLVTDGIPTVSAAGGSPLEEALREAAQFRGTGVNLCCIGLEPNERYLAELARRAGGSLHVVAELRPELLADVARRERARLRQSGTS